LFFPALPAVAPARRVALVCMQVQEGAGRRVRRPMKILFAALHFHGPWWREAGAWLKKQSFTGRVCVFAREGDKASTQGGQVYGERRYVKMERKGFYVDGTGGHDATFAFDLLRTRKHEGSRLFAGVLGTPAVESECANEPWYLWLR